MEGPKDVNRYRKVVRPFHNVLRRDSGLTWEPGHRVDGNRQQQEVFIVNLRSRRPTLQH